jgi:hypothetical protein
MGFCASTQRYRIVLSPLETPPASLYEDNEDEEADVCYCSTFSYFAYVASFFCAVEEMDMHVEALVESEVFGGGSSVDRDIVGCSLASSSSSSLVVDDGEGATLPHVSRSPTSIPRSTSLARKERHPHPL